MADSYRRLDFLSEPPIDLHALKRIRLRVLSDDPVHRGLKKLKCRGRDLGSLPPEVFHLLELEVLDLSPERETCLHYRLQVVPPAIGKLVNLRVLMLDTNELAELPPEIALLAQLERLSLSNNVLQGLPDGFARLSRLQSVHLANNRMQRFPLPLLRLERLQFLDLSDNALADLPDGISRLRGLESLLLFLNRLRQLPDSICELVGLRVLWVGNNLLKRLPRNFGRLRNLDWGYRHTCSCVVDGNPLVLPPVEVCKMGPDAIDKYMQRAETHMRNM